MSLCMFLCFAKSQFKETHWSNVSRHVNFVSFIIVTLGIGIFGTRNIQSVYFYYSTYSWAFSCQILCNGPKISFSNLCKQKKKKNMWKLYFWEEHSSVFECFSQFCFGDTTFQSSKHEYCKRFTTVLAQPLILHRRMHVVIMFSILFSWMVYYMYT